MKKTLPLIGLAAVLAGCSTTKMSNDPSQYPLHAARPLPSTAPVMQPKVYPYSPQFNMPSIPHAQIYVPQTNGSVGLAYEFTTATIAGKQELASVYSFLADTNYTISHLTTRNPQHVTGIEAGQITDVCVIHPVGTRAQFHLNQHKRWHPNAVLQDVATDAYTFGVTIVPQTTNAVRTVYTHKMRNDALAAKATVGTALNTTVAALVEPHAPYAGAVAGLSLVNAGQEYISQLSDDQIRKNHQMIVSENVKVIDASEKPAPAVMLDRALQKSGWALIAPIGYDSQIILSGKSGPVDFSTLQYAGNLTNADFTTINTPQKSYQTLGNATKAGVFGLFMNHLHSGHNGSGSPKGSIGGGDGNGGPGEGLGN